MEVENKFVDLCQTSAGDTVIADTRVTSPNLHYRSRSNDQGRKSGQGLSFGLLQDRILQKPPQVKPNSGHLMF